MLVDYNPVEGTISLEGRDLTGLLIDKKSTINFVNLSSSQIAERLAEKHGLTPIVTETRGQVGKYYNIDSRLLFDQRSDWEVLQYLAQVEDFMVYVSNTSLVFGPSPEDSAAPYTYAPYVIRWTPPMEQAAYPSANVQMLELSREKTVSRGVEVIVMSWNPKTGTRFVGYWPLKPTDGTVDPNTVTFGDAVVHRHTVPGLTQQQCDQRAESLYKSIVQHELKLRAEMPGDVVLGINSPIQLVGTGTDYDQIYYPDSITRRMSWDGGFSMSVSAKNIAEAA